MYPGPMERSLGFVAVQPRNGTITIPAEARRALRLDLPGAQVEVILRDHDLVLLPHVAVPLERVRDNGTAPGSGGG
jgi:bifunctional DNA-binding transcriptional regulator/antitoxin component of YhaV-PrlF toxin-antitoxin module